MINDQETPRHLVMSYQDAPTRTIDASGVRFAYRELGPATGVPVIFLTHLAAVLDNWDPRVVDGIAAKHRVITFDNRGVGASTGSTPDTNRATDVFVHDMTSGVTRRVSVTGAGAQANAYSDEPALSSDGRVIAFESLAGNLVAGDTNGKDDVFVRRLG